MIGEVLLYLAFWPGMLFFVYWPTQYFLVDFARHQTRFPGALYYHACVLLVAAPIAAIPLYVIVGLMSVLLLVVFGVTDPDWVGWLLWGVPGAGWIGWLRLGAGWLGTAPARAAYRRLHPLPKLQCWLQEILVAVLVFGLVMAILSTLFDEAGWALACYLLLAMGLGFLVGLDILRRMPVSVRPATRGATLVGVMLWFAASAVIGGLVAWVLWRSALLAAEIEE